VKFIADSDGAHTGDLPGAVLIDATSKGAGTVFIVLDGPRTVIDGFHLTGGTDAGIQVRRGSAGTQVRNNVVFSNARRGIEALRADGVQIENNLVYVNGTGGIRVAECENSVVVNNTAYGNGVDPILGAEADGILIGGGVELAPTRGTVVMRNIVQGNPVGILATNTAYEGYVTGFNLSLDGFPGSTPRADSDFVADALFVNPAGVDGILGGSGFADDAFYLLQEGVLVSPAVDIDYGEIDTLTNGSTRSDGRPDTGPGDAGYHYPSK
jgi:parallel beta-helix repeat protein